MGSPVTSLTGTLPAGSADGPPAAPRADVLPAGIRVRTAERLPMTTAASPPSGDALTGTTAPGTSALGPRGLLILITLCGATFMTGLDYSIITVALPEIGRDLGFASTGDLQWVATACLLPTAGLLPLFGRLCDLVGRRRLFVLGAALFTALSLLAAAATGPALLIAARAGQGVAAAMIGPTALALMTASFPEGPRRTKALGINGALLSLGFVTGTIGGGLITSGFNWRWTMLLLALIGSAVLVGALTVLPASADARRAGRLDVPGALLSSAGLFALVYAISTGADAGWASAPTLTALTGAVALLAAFLFTESRHSAPLVPLGLLGRRTVKWSALVGLITFSMCGGATLLLSLYMQDVLGWSPLATGFGFLAEGAAALVAGTLASRVIAARGTTAAMVSGLLVQAAGTGAMVLLPGNGSLPLLLVTSGLMGFGHVLAVVAFISTLTSGLRDDEQGVAGSLAQMPQFVGAIGVAGLAAVAASGDSLLAGLHAALLVAGGTLLAGVLVAALFLRRRGPEC
ncbi:MFS transporter [Streptomyces sp. NPDC090132]|uniref:MFS transporter n=1 Tax=Streptomyces sp. NPDC090132 TaxID=3365955 RepID=UPI0037F6B870